MLPSGTRKRGLTWGNFGAESGCFRGRIKTGNYPMGGFGAEVELISFFSAFADK
jgi:hypothetical protein